VADQYRKISERRPPELIVRVVYPAVLRLLGPLRGRRVLDVGCGSGAFTRRLAARGAEALGIDACVPTVEAARRDAEEAGIEPPPRFEVADLQGDAPFPGGRFHAATLVLSLQTLEKPERVLRNTARALKPGGRLVLALNHPCFRIPGSTFWGSDPDRDIQFRRVDRYRSSHPVEVRSGEDPEQKVLAFHWSLERLFGDLRAAGFLVEDIVEPVSSQGAEQGRAGAEDRARREIPLFLVLVARLRPPRSRRAGRKASGSG
jgi:SAM-dependent methyltransferase